ncbi:hypothetical protein ACFQ7F_42540 [Streptomyces sp. NPDC056486]|uniref:hypothetical protein n=1 Tax=Streptomyces sp. NPDC056486 TaxID=3345835 RepID=UPI0036A8E58E
MPTEPDTFSGWGKSEFTIPGHFVGTEFFIEIWGSLLGRGFWVHGEFEEAGFTKQEPIGSSSAREKLHMPVSGRYRRLVINGATALDRAGRWNVECKAISQLPELLAENTGGVSRAFIHRGDEAPAHVQFQGAGCVRSFDLDGGHEEELASNTGSFSGTVKIPAKSLITVSAPFRSWGPMQKWKLTLK